MILILGLVDELGRGKTTLNCQPEGGRVRSLGSTHSGFSQSRGASLDLPKL